MYTNLPRTLGQLKNNICGIIDNIGTDMLEKVDRNFKICLSHCIDKDRGRL